VKTRLGIGVLIECDTRVGVYFRFMSCLKLRISTIFI